MRIAPFSILLSLASGGVLACASGAPEPPDVNVDRVENVVPAYPAPPELDDPGTIESLSRAPTFTPYTVRPDIKNRTVVARTLEKEYPPLLRDAGISGTAKVWFLIDAEGIVRKTQINESSGHEALDRAALNVANVIEFTSALNGDKKVPVWISLPMTFTTR